ncbi:hypothetical protein IAR55_000283 [Kwoniella newhampshirensis]|uniref:DUF7082 domain-containing protein n=1 Tax=Kwoniella newhampshirensis TaxID=1651941 RepID=A0AAW0Z6S3_9TREE
MYQTSTSHSSLLPPPSQHRLYQPPTLNYSRSQYTPRSGMDSFGLPPSPSSQFSPDTPSTSAPYATSVGSAMLQSRPYMSPHLSGQFNELSTHSPAMLQSRPGPSSMVESHVVVHEWGPNEGAQGTQISVKCDVNFPSSTPSSINDGSSPDPSPRMSGKALRVVFGQHPVQTAVHLLMTPGQMGAGQMCQLSATVPSWSTTGAAGMGGGNRVQVFVQVLAENHAIVESVPLGDFIYGNGPVRGNSLKRGGDSLESSRPSPHAVHRRVISTSSAAYGTPELQQYPTMPSAYHPSPSTRSVAESSGSWQSPYMASSSSLPSVPQPAPPPYTPGLQPSLMRSTQLTPGVPAPTPYVNSGQKACLELNGDLMSMSKGWTTEEWHSRRRLVQFWRRQEGTTIHAAFKPISQAEYPAYQQSIIISCIFREDKNACFVTSVDAIYLLEALVGTRFTVEEKNRIRRNLEGFRPITVSKSKPGSEDFFRLIMNFPNPRPRNIEKDVKVFPWEILGSALKKIIGKYSASFPYPQSNPMPPPPPPSMLPPPHFAMPHPLQPMMSAPAHENDYVKDEYSQMTSSTSGPTTSGSAPHLISHSSSDSSTSYAQSSAYSHPTTNNPHTPQHGGSPGAYRTVSGSGTTPQAHGSEEKGGSYVNLSPSYAQQPGQWAHSTNVDLNDPTGGASGSYVLSGGLGYPDQPHQLPHVHQSGVSRHPSSSDLRVMYPGMS